MPLSHLLIIALVLAMTYQLWESAEEVCNLYYLYPSSRTVQALEWLLWPVRSFDEFTYSVGVFSTFLQKNWLVSVWKWAEANFLPLSLLFAPFQMAVQWKSMPFVYMWKLAKVVVRYKQVSLDRIAAQKIHPNSGNQTAPWIDLPLVWVRSTYSATNLLSFCWLTMTQKLWPKSKRMFCFK